LEEEEEGDYEGEKGFEVGFLNIDFISPLWFVKITEYF